MGCVASAHFSLRCTTLCSVALLTQVMFRLLCHQRSLLVLFMLPGGGVTRLGKRVEDVEISLCSHLRVNCTSFRAFYRTFKEIFSNRATARARLVQLTILKYSWYLCLQKSQGMRLLKIRNLILTVSKTHKCKMNCEKWTVNKYSATWCCENIARTFVVEWLSLLCFVHSCL